MPPSNNGISIGDLARRSGANPPTIRYYEQIGLVRRAARTASGRRTYDAADIARLTFIRRCRDFDFSIDQVKRLVALLDDASRSCLEARDLAQAHLGDVRRKLCDLRALEKTLAAFVADCDKTCAGGPGKNCAVLQDLTRPTSRAGSAKRRSRQLVRGA